MCRLFSIIYNKPFQDFSNERAVKCSSLSEKATSNFTFVCLIHFLSFETDSYYEGAWECDQRHGTGKMIHPDGSIYDGEWKNDMENGQGVLFMANGDVYRGSWKDGKKHGDGEYHFKVN